MYTDDCQIYLSTNIKDALLVENGASHIYEYDRLINCMTGGRFAVDLEKL